MKRNFFPLLFIIIPFLSQNLFCQSYTGTAGTTFASLDNPNIISGNPPAFRSSNSLEYGVGTLNKNTPIDLQFNTEVENTINYFLAKRRADIEVYLQRSTYYFPLIEELLDKYDLPLELKYIAVIESGLNPLAKSSSGAVGIWQFLFSTCSLFDLKVDSYIDERRDIYKSTEAACRYMQYLYRTYNDWNLVMAGYCGGPGDVRKAIERSGGKTDYWEIRPFLTEQARNYIPTFIAVDYLMNYYEAYNIAPGKLSYSWSDVDTIQINYSVSFQQIASVLGIPVSEIEWLNPVYRKGIIPDLPEPCILILPKNHILNYIRNESRIIAVSVPEKDYNTLIAFAGTTDNRKMITHTVRSGEYFHKIAINYNCTIENIKAWNNLNSLNAYPGQILKIWIPGKDEY